VDKVTVDVEEAGAIRLDIDDVVVPDLVVEGARRGHGRVVFAFLGGHRCPGFL